MLRSSWENPHGKLHSSFGREKRGSKNPLMKIQPCNGASNWKLNLGSLCLYKLDLKNGWNILTKDSYYRLLHGHLVMNVGISGCQSIDSNCNPWLNCKLKIKKIIDIQGPAMTDSNQHIPLNQVDNIHQPEAQEWVHSPEEKHLFISFRASKRGDM